MYIMSKNNIHIPNNQFSANMFTNKNPIACSSNVSNMRSNNLIQKGGNWAYEHFNHAGTPSYGYAPAGAPISHELKANIYPAMSENNSYNPKYGGYKKKRLKRKKTKRRRQKTKKRRKTKRGKRKNHKKTKHRKKIKHRRKTKK
jgi:hypothetical protein